MELKGKNVLITQSALRSFGGSEIVTLELANYFKSIDAKVKVFTWYYSEPIKSEFEKHHIDVTTDEDDPFFENVDFVWIHHQVLPISMVQDLGKKRKKPTFVFFHMSYMEDLYLEQPYILGLEKKLSDKSIFVSEEAMAMNVKKCSDAFRNPSVFRNFSPEEFVIHLVKNETLKKVGIVSNRPPKEVLDSIELFKAKGVEAELIGRTSKTYELITPDVLNRYDCIITIGKTIQYCLTSNIPTYLYDRFGGCGFITHDNFKKAMGTNFSGRGFDKKAASKIVSEIINGYSSAREYQEKNLEFFQEQFSLSNNLTKLLNNITPRTKEVFDSEYINHIIAAETLVKNKIVAENGLSIVLEDNKKLQDAINDLNAVINRMNSSRIIRIDRKLRSIIKAPLRILKKKPAKVSSVVEINKDDFEFTTLKKGHYKIIGLVLERNESLILKDTLDSLCKIVDGFILLDDCSDDDSLNIAKNHPKCLAVIRHKTHAAGDRSAQESIHRELLLRQARKYHPAWLVYQDADERIDDPAAVRKFLTQHMNDDSISGIRLSLFDAYMTEKDQKSYQGGPLLNFRKYFGQERRDILMIWKNKKKITFATKLVAREPDLVDESKLITKFYVQHYGKSLGIEHWEETCDYYINHFPQYAAKWAARKGKGVHKKLSDFDTELQTWEQVKKSGGIKIN